MSRTTPQMRDFAERLIFHETRENRSSETKCQAAIHVCEKLRPHLATLMGKAGFRALLSRALAVAAADVPWLRALELNADGNLAAFNESAERVDQGEKDEGCVLLVAQLLGLLVVFIGETLTLSFVREAWPKVSLNDLDFESGGKK